MTPVTNKPPMPQAPGKGIKSFPTPVIDDVVITEIVNAWKGDYKALDYGVKWDEAPHASMQGSHPDHKLVFQDPASADGEWIKRIWVNDRVNQDSYNYAIKYSGGSQSHPIYIRTYVLPREGYVPLPDLTPDDVYPTALLVEEEVQRNEGELDSKYIKVVRVFETLQGPGINSFRYNERGDLEEVISQQVTPNTTPAPDGLLVTQSQVIKEDVSKGTKTTATVTSHSTLTSKEKKEGLLGETIVTDDIVDPTTSPDALSTTVISSSVEQTSKTKARKRTVTSTGPTSLSKKNKDGKLLGDTAVVRSIVAPTTLPDLPSALILSSEVDQTDSGKAIKTNIVLNSTPTLKGSKQSQGLLGTTTTQETVVLAGSLADSLTLNIVSSQVEPIDSVRSRKVTETSSGPMTLSGDSSKGGLFGQTKISETIVPSNSPTDPLSLSVLSSEVTPIDSSKSKKTTVTSTGPKSLSKLSKDGKLLGDTKVTRSVVVPTTSPDALSIFVLSSEVDQIDSGKAIKTNVFLNSTPTLKGSKQSQGLLGTTTTQETVVPAGSLADNLTLNIVSSQVEPIDSVRSRKVTETSSGPMTLSGDSSKGGLFGITKITEEIVPSGTSPVILNLNTISSEVTPIDESKSKRTTIEQTSVKLKSKTLSPSQLGLVTSEKTQEIVVNQTQPENDLYTISDNIDSIDESKSKREVLKVDKWPKLNGIEYDYSLGLGNFYTKEIIDPNTYTNTSIKNSYDADPIDEFKSLKKDYDLNLIGQQLDSIYYIIESATNITLPDTLRSVVAYFGLSGGSGTDNSSASGAGTSYNYSVSGSSKSSSSAKGDIHFNIKKGFSGSIASKEHNFFLKTIDLSSGSKGITTQKSILNKLNENSNLAVGSSTSIQYTTWPVIRSVTENIIIIGGSKSKSMGSGSSASMSLNGSSTATNDTTSFDVDVSVNSITLPEALHDEIIIAKVAIGSMDPSTLITYDVKPSSIDATSFKKFPIGNYLISSSVELYKFGYSRVKAITVEITEDYI